MAKLLFILFTVLLSQKQIKASVKWRPGMESFTHSVKQGGCEGGLEVSLYESTKGPGVITEQWFTGKGCINQDTIIRYYIDGDSKPSIEVNLYLAHGIGYPDENRFSGKDFAAASTSKAQSNKNKAETSEKNNKRNYPTSKILEGVKATMMNKTSDLVEETMHHEQLASKRGFLPNDGHVHMEEDEEGLEPNDENNTSKRTEPDEGESDSEIPWGTRRIGHIANNGGIYNTFRIPFQKSIYITFISKQHGHYWYNIRGVRNYPVIIGDLELPREAKLKVHKKEDVKVAPFDYISLASSTGKSGLLYLVELTTESSNFYHQEGCFRVITDENNKTQYLSSGTEDLFLSAYYYNGGTFHNDHAGLSYKKIPGRVSAYKFFEDDPVIFNKRFELIWRCGELADNECFKIHQKSCTRKYGRKACVNDVDYEGMAKFNETNRKHIRPTIVNSYAWVYEW
ncbi:uncharacterized protein LOC135681334 [Rhopilema esculentum]|uniref:uncharacterized protein LOC135681334 n=1 Tax=Rhopilema esculentum TaxID=499914 RepID=UPI0031DB094A|eukprot:gene13194-4003_t